MKKLKEYKFILIAVSAILLLTVIFAATQYTSPQDKAVGDWELSGTFENFELRYWDWGEYEYFNLHLSESGAATIFSYPTFSTANSTATEMATYYLAEEKNGQYDYLIKLFMTNDNELDYYTTRLLYNSKRDELMFFTSLDDGLLLKRAEKLTTVEITTTEEATQNKKEMIDYKSRCADYVNSKNLVRYEDRYVGGNYCYTGQVFNIYESDNVYVILTDENSDGLYGDNWMYVQDCREFDKTKILETDIITIYGTFTGVSTDNYPCFDFYYADIKGVQ